MENELRQVSRAAATRMVADDYRAPYPAYSARPPRDRELVMSMVGIQAHLEDSEEALGHGRTLLQEFLGLAHRAADDRPLVVELTWHQDVRQSRNDVVLAYWPTWESMRAFFERPDVAAWRARELTDDVGWWRESFAVPPTALDGNYSVQDPAYGISRHHEVLPEQYHSYMGSMRDRTPDYLSGEKDGPTDEPLTRVPAVHSRGRHLVVDELPDNLCFIRGAWGWRQAGPDEQRAFVEQMLPVLSEGSLYLSQNPEESGCVSLRQTESVPLGHIDTVQVEVLGWFRTLQDLERWTRSHPRHLAIMENILGYMRRFDFKPKLNLGHEVSVISADRLEAEYSNCHPDTGFLPFFASRSMGR